MRTRTTAAARCSRSCGCSSVHLRSHGEHFHAGSLIPALIGSPPLGRR